MEKSNLHKNQTFQQYITGKSAELRDQIQNTANITNSQFSKNIEVLDSISQTNMKSADALVAQIEEIQPTISKFMQSLSSVNAAYVNSNDANIGSIQKSLSDHMLAIESLAASIKKEIQDSIRSAKLQCQQKQQEVCQLFLWFRFHEHRICYLYYLNLY